MFSNTFFKKMLAGMVVLTVFASFTQAQTRSSASQSRQQVDRYGLTAAARTKLAGAAYSLLGADKETLLLKSRAVRLLALDSSSPKVGVFVRGKVTRAQLEAIPGVEVRSRFGELFTVTVPIDALPALALMPDVISVTPARKLYPENDSARTDSRVPEVWQRTISTLPSYAGYSGKGVIVGVIDTGIDWDHGDFIDDATGQSRILSIWDQTLTAQTGESTPAGYAYGVEYTRTHINDEIDGTPAGYVRSQDTNGHGTHVSGTAAGDGSDTGDASYAPAYTYTGMAPEADIIMVKYGGGGFEDVVADAIDYIFSKAAAEGKPAVINISLGTHFGAHDGTSPLEMAIDNAVGQGKVIVKSAGNSGTTAADAEYIHAEGTVGVGDTAVVEFTVPSYTELPGAGNDYILLEMWYQGQDSLKVEVIRPNGTSSSATTGNSVGSIDSDGYIGLFNADTGPNANNGDNNCSIEIWDQSLAGAPAAGVWTVRVIGDAVNESGHFDVWIAGINLGAAGTKAWFTKGWDDDEIVSIPGTSSGGITVAAYSTKTTFDSQDGNTYTYTSAVLHDLADFSSYGVRTDDGGSGLLTAQKPDIAGSGFGVISALSTNSGWVGSIEQNRDLTHLIMSGTSMSSPHVTGMAALLLQQNPDYTAAQIKDLLKRHARTDAYTGSTPSFKWGAGKADVFAAAGGTTPPAAVSGLNAASGSVKLSWNAVTADTSGDPEYISEYIIYRSTTPFFTPTPADSIASTTATTWTDTSALAVGDTSKQYVYTVIAVDDFGNRSAVGGYAGEYDNKLVKNTSSTSSTFISVVFTGSGLATASDLADSIGVCDLVSKWDVPAQAWVAYTPGLAFTDFALTAGDAYMVSVTSDTVFTQFGTLFRNKTFQLDTTSTTNSNAISVPMNRTDLTMASDLVADIGPEVDLISYWDAYQQSWIAHTPGLGFTDFAIRPGMALMVSVTAPVTWASP